jgi:hypothetical protein
MLSRCEWIDCIWQSGELQFGTQMDSLYRINVDGINNSKSRNDVDIINNSNNYKYYRNKKQE